MKTSVSLWSADLLDVGAAIACVEAEVAGFHIDIMDGHFVPELTFGPDFVRAVAKRTHRLVDVHLMVGDAERWIEPFVAAGAGMLTIHPRSCADAVSALRSIRSCRIGAGIAVELGDALEDVQSLLREVDRVLLMGTALGVKGVEIDTAVYERIRQVAKWREQSQLNVEIYVDGGIRKHTAPFIAMAGADGVTPGSLVYGAADPAAVVRWLATLP
ncbi:MAG: ribulose-phosphate 3-epimerase [Chloroflexi bacterium]|nr:ribulose-phosphate 3-epimerase [Chloroflexota bacterium]